MALIPLDEGGGVWLPLGYGRSRDRGSRIAWDRVDRVASRGIADRVGDRVGSRRSRGIA